MKLHNITFILTVAMSPIPLIVAEASRLQVNQKMIEFARRYLEMQQEIQNLHLEVNRLREQNEIMEIMLGLAIIALVVIAIFWGAKKAGLDKKPTLGMNRFLFIVGFLLVGNSIISRADLSDPVDRSGAILAICICGVPFYFTYKWAERKIKKREAEHNQEKNL